MNLAPREDIGWDVHGDGRLAIRSSYGLSFDYPTGEFMSNPAAAPPFGNRVRLTDPPGGFDNPYGHLPGGDPHPIVTGPGHLSSGSSWPARTSRAAMSTAASVPVA